MHKLLISCIDNHRYVNQLNCQLIRMVDIVTITRLTSNQLLSNERRCNLIQSGLYLTSFLMGAKNFNQVMLAPWLPDLQTETVTNQLSEPRYT